MPQKVENYKLETDGTLMYKNIIFIRNVHDLKLMILNEMHNVPCWVCVIFFARVVVSERLRRACRGVRGGVQGFGGSAPEKFFFLGRHIFAGFGPTYYRRADIFPGPHDIRWFSAHGFCRWFSISG
jgi:hypothetical protein